MVVVRDCVLDFGDESDADRFGNHVLVSVIVIIVLVMRAVSLCDMLGKPSVRVNVRPLRRVCVLDGVTRLADVLTVKVSVMVSAMRC